MLKSCKHCGKIHDSKIKCKSKPKVNTKSKNISEQNTFRNTKMWQRKREEIKQRDGYLCKVCYDIGMLKYNKLSVHHIVSIKNDYDLRLENDNLITLCEAHHKQADNGELSKEYLRKLIKIKK